jgi:hypothetical protein
MTYAVLKHFNVASKCKSRHLALWGGYVVVGHIPIEDIDRLLAGRPDVEGITLPGVPPGSPGMPGEKSGEWKIYAFKNGRVWLYAVS